MKRISTKLLAASSLALALTACGEDTQPEEGSTEQTTELTEVDQEAAVTEEHGGVGGTAGAVTHSAELGSICATCGPLPDPWRKAGPLPDPWKSTSSGGTGTGTGTSTGTGTGSGAGSSGH